jgi:hypothetical protein
MVSAATRRLQVKYAVERGLSMPPRLSAGARCAFESRLQATSSGT